MGVKKTITKATSKETLDSCFLLFIHDRTYKNRAPSTIESYEDTYKLLKKYCEFNGKESVSVVVPQTIFRFIDCCEEKGISISWDGNYVILNYKFLPCDFNDPIVRACRGTILKKENDSCIKVTVEAFDFVCYH